MKHALPILLLALAGSGCQRAAAPDPRIGAIADRLAIDQLVAGDYPRALDARDWDAYVANFTDDGELSLGPQSVKGKAGIKGMVSGLPTEPHVIHVISNLSYKIDGDAATGGAYWQDIGIGDSPHGVLAAGHYVDSLRKVAGAWKFTRREIVIQAQEPENAVPASPAP
jgi:ketosteroid isomerase-like protein